MSFFKKSYDGGTDSGVTGYWLIEWKKGFSIVLLRFSPGSREAYHSHAFNAITLWLAGEVVEDYPNKNSRAWFPMSIKYTPRNLMHRIIAGTKGAWALSVRGPWADTWEEIRGDERYTLTHGRVRVAVD